MDIRSMPVNCNSHAGNYVTTKESFSNMLEISDWYYQPNLEWIIKYMLCLVLGQT
jgi:hypothetical protein